MSTLSRRTFLRGAAGALIALPWLEAFGTRTLSAGEPLHGPRCFVFHFVPNGYAPGAWFPSGNALELMGSLRPLEPHKQDVNVFKNLTNTAWQLKPGSENHTAASCALLTGRPAIGDQDPPRTNCKGDGISLDMLIAQSHGGATPLKNLYLSTSNNPSLSWGGSGQGMQYDKNTGNMLNRVFGEQTDEQELLRRVERHRSVLDALDDDYTSLQSKLGYEDRMRLESHLESIRGVEKRLAIARQCSNPGEGIIRGTQDIRHGQHPEVLEIMMDLTVLALQCDITRVATLAFRYAGGGRSYFPWIDGLGGPEDREAQTQADYQAYEHHELTHALGNEEKRARVASIIEWYVAHTAYLVQALKNVQEGDKTLYDRTVVMQGSEHGQNHSASNLPMLLFSGGGSWGGGKYVNLPEATPHNRLLVRVMNEFGIEGDVFGDARACDGGALAF